MAKVLVTGGAGFIGSYIVKELIKKKHTPIILDMFLQFTSPLEESYKEERAKRFEGILDKVILERGNIAHYSVLYGVLQRHKPDYIIHLAALPVTRLPNLNVAEALEGTVNSTAHMLELIGRMKEQGIHEVKKFLYTSSSMVYGDFKTDPVSENHPTDPTTIYGVMKLAGEVVTRGLCKKYKINYCIIRPSAVYGPTDMNRRVSQILIENAFKGKPLIVKGGEEEKLDFTHVTDVAQGFILATFSEKANGETFNMTGGNAHSILEYARIVQKYFQNIKIIQKPRDKKMPKRGTLDISKAKKLLGYSPKYNIEKGIKEYIKFIKKKKGEV